MLAVDAVVEGHMRCIVVAMTVVAGSLALPVHMMVAVLAVVEHKRCIG